MGSCLSVGIGEGQRSIMVDSLVASSQARAPVPHGAASGFRAPAPGRKRIKNHDKAFES